MTEDAMKEDEPRCIECRVGVSVEDIDIDSLLNPPDEPTSEGDY